MALLPYIMLCQHAKRTNARPPAFTVAGLRSLKWHVRTYSVIVVKSAADGKFQRAFTVLWVWLVPQVCTIWGNPTHACQWKQQQQQHFDSKKERKCWKTASFWRQVVWRWSLRSFLTCRINKKKRHLSRWRPGNSSPGFCCSPINQSVVRKAGRGNALNKKAVVSAATCAIYTQYTHTDTKCRETLICSLI